MSGMQNKIVYGEGMKITPTSNASLVNMQQASTDVGSINHTGNPNGVVSANPGSLCHDPVSGTVYRKSFGTSNIGWLDLGTDITLTGNSGGAISAVSNNFNLFIANAFVKFVGTAGTQTLDFAPGITGSLGLGDNLATLTAADVTAYGVGALHSITSGNGNSFFGFQAGYNITTATGNSGFGNGVMGNNVNGIDNSSFGNGSSSNNTGTQNCVFGSGALQGGGGGGGGAASENVVSGYRSGFDLTSATNNCYYGWSSGLQVRTGSFNIGIGSSAGSLNTLADSSDIYIGHVGVAGENNTTRIGTQGSGAAQQNRFFAAGVTGVTVTGSAPIGVDTNGQFSSLGFGTLGNVLTSNGAATSPTYQSLASLGGITSVTGSSGGAQVPSAGNFNILGSGSITTAGTANTETISLTGLTNHALLVGAGTATITNVGPSATTGQVLQSQGSSTDPAYSTATYPGTTTLNQLLYSSSANVVAGLATATNGVLITDGTTGIPSISSTLPSAVQGNITSVGTVTSGTWNATTVAVNHGGTGQSTLTNHGVLVGSGTTAITQLAAGTAGQVLQSGGASADPAYSTATFPTTAGTSGNILTSNGTNWVSSAPATAGTVTSVSGTANRVTSTGGTTPVLDISASYVGQSSITTLGTVTTGVWNGTAITVAKGGTGLTSTTAYGLIAGGTTTTGTFQNTGAGTTGQYLQSNGSAALPAFAALPSQASVASVAVNTTISNVTGDGTLYFPIIFDTKFTDPGTNFSTGTGLFTAPTTGNYLINANITLSGLTVADTNGEVRIIINGSTFTRFQFNPGVLITSGVASFPVSFVAALTATNTVSIGVLISGSTKSVSVQGNSGGYETTASFIFLG